jgi:7-carboxy-7-deazaguanine synthase
VNIAEIFYSIEGEGVAIGKPEIFVRLAGCNLRCEWCDTKYALDNGRQMTVDVIIEEVMTYPCKNVSITGGEPLLQSQELLGLITKIKDKGFWVQLNTNGTILDRAIFKTVDLVSIDCKCPSSKMKSDLSVLRNVNESIGEKTQFKFVIANEEDFEYAKSILSQLKLTTCIFQPEWHNRKYAKKLIEEVKSQAINARIILQQHKVVWGNTKGK